MSATLGRLSAHLAEPADAPATTQLVELINRTINPPDRLSADDVHIRAMFIVSNEVNSFGGCFPADEHRHLCRLLPDSPVMVGHRKDKLPIGRTFHAEIVERSGASWVKTYFYWLRKADGSETLRENIDGGVCKECSISFTFLFPECSICGKDIRLCRHQPFETYDEGGDSQVCHFLYRRIERVLETSLVYRGAVPDTSITKDLVAGDGGREARLGSVDDLPADGEFLVTPYYEGIPIRMTGGAGRLSVARLDAGSLPDDLGASFEVAGPSGFSEAVGYLVGLRGKERCRTEHLERFLDGGSSPVTRVEARLLPPAGTTLTQPCDGNARYAVRWARCQRTSRDDIEAVSVKLATRDGVRIWTGGEEPVVSAGYRFLPDETAAPAEGGYRLVMAASTGAARILLSWHGEQTSFDIRQFNLRRFDRGGRFVADRVQAGTRNTASGQGTAINGRIAALAAADDTLTVECAGRVSGTVRIRPVRIDGRRLYLIYRVGG